MPGHPHRVAGAGLGISVHVQDHVTQEIHITCDELTVVYVQLVLSGTCCRSA